MDDLVSSVESVSDGASDKPFLAFVVFALCFFLALAIWFAPVRES
jgi:hypothetical protein